MSVVYEGAHSIKFGTIDTWTNLHLIPVKAPYVAAPSVQTTYVEVPGRDGALDYTEALSGEPKYNDREGSWEFYIDNTTETMTSFEIYSLVLNSLHGKYFDNIVLSDLPKYHYKGRLTVSEISPEADFSTVAISYRLEPFKYDSGDNKSL